ncbi:MAG: reverse transcriptase/maturase family protein [Polyangiaceae bacterium]|nr:reverse transcriptase/maturase family protein [Polyangiaceae bacterium]
MPQRSRVSLDDIASLDTLTAAFWQASRGKRSKQDVQRFSAQLDAEFAHLRGDILLGRAPEGRWTSFRIFDPKPRLILAPCFRDRVLHHAMMIPMGPVLERALVADTFACRPGKGTLAAVLRVQHHLRRFPWFVKADCRAYFASIDHAILRSILSRRFKDPGLLALCDRVLDRAPVNAGTGSPQPSRRGLPIGALSSQYFANTYLDGLDRFLLEKLRVRAMVRYMDDIVWWCDTRPMAEDTLAEARDFVARERSIELKPDARVARSAEGLAFLGFRVLPGVRRLLLRRRRRYAAARARWERAFMEGSVDGLGLQTGYSAALAVTAHADAVAFRRAELMRRPPVDA